jgi:hypothetical protein
MADPLAPPSILRFHQQLDDAHLPLDRNAPAGIGDPDVQVWHHHLIRYLVQNPSGSYRRMIASSSAVGDDVSWTSGATLRSQPVLARTLSGDWPGW